MGLFSDIGKKKGWAFAGGIVAGLILPSIAKSKATRKVAVNATAKYLRTKDGAVACSKSIKEEAEDIYAEAKQKETSKVASE